MPKEYNNLFKEGKLDPPVIGFTYCSFSEL